MEHILNLNSKVAFVLSIISFCCSYIVKKLFEHPDPDDFLAPLGQGMANLASSGLYYVAMGLLFIAIVKFIYEMFLDHY